MKKLMILFLFSITGLISFAQSSASISKEELVNSKSTQTFTYLIPASKTSKDVNDVKGYYKTQLSVTFNEAKHLLTVQVLDPSQIRVMGRLLVALDCRIIVVDGVEMSFDEMYDTYLK